jgi:hypothetical protein
LACQHLPCPRKKTPLHSKKTRQPCVFHAGSRSPRSASLHSGLSSGCHPRSTRSRLVPLHCAGKKPLRYRSADFFTCFVPAQGCFTCVVLATLTPAPDHPPLKYPDSSGCYFYGKI